MFMILEKRLQDISSKEKTTNENVVNKPIIKQTRSSVKNECFVSVKLCNHKHLWKSGIKFHFSLKTNYAFRVQGNLSSVLPRLFLQVQVLVNASSFR